MNNFFTVVWLVILFVGVGVVTYLMWSFVNWSLDITEWHWIVRIFAGTTQFITLCWCTGTLMDEWE